MRRLPSLTALLVFEAAARLENLSRAGEELGVTQGAISRQVKALERWARVLLFERRGRRLSLTDAGRTYAQTLTGAFDSIAAAGERLRTTATWSSLPGRRRTPSSQPSRPGWTRKLLRDALLGHPPLRLQDDRRRPQMPASESRSTTHQRPDCNLGELAAPDAQQLQREVGHQ